ncbi:3-hydroxyacyl-CoA dehydrogenase [Allonocardiopsis opalescens]|uniref:3-hydroxybutyryl-CoA dehydrogenase n=1 Tax=Allonocardiopsis opalescens TaxID=1144618 RepID=A0A2T0QD72_9ACTN|nr:3-hydroxybutyryl-CoA dehydrogenase [Allonocardiopsis opalescens]PRY01803.1 3-hydroxybutyryl-CoA dehydrogenase [Allonocardiopsis opalescens]
MTDDMGADGARTGTEAAADTAEGAAAVRTVGVVGLGTMGAGIAEVFARAGLDVVGVEADAAALDAGRRRLDASLARAVQRGRLSDEDRDGIVGRIALYTERAALAAADLVVEVVPERIEAKREVFAELDRIVPEGAVLATNTSSLAVTEIAACTTRPERVVGMHFFNPAPVMELVEVVTTVRTEPAAAALASGLAARVGKTPVTVGDRAGFVANALLLPFLNHAVVLLEERVASRDDIDAAVRDGIGLPMGPLALLDLIGLDVSLAVLDVLWAEFRDPRYAAAPLLRRMVAAGLLGRKTGRGFHRHADDGAQEPEFTASPLGEVLGGPNAVTTLLLLAHMNDAVRMVQCGYATPDQVETAMRLGCGYPRGPLELLDGMGLDNVLKGLEVCHQTTRNSGFLPTALLRHLVDQGATSLRASVG